MTREIYPYSKENVTQTRNHELIVEILEGRIFRAFPGYAYRHYSLNLRTLYPLDLLHLVPLSKPFTWQAAREIFLGHSGHLCGRTIGNLTETLAFLLMPHVFTAYALTHVCNHACPTAHGLMWACWYWCPSFRPTYHLLITVQSVPKGSYLEPEYGEICHTLLVCCNEHEGNKLISTMSSSAAGPCERGCLSTCSIFREEEQRGSQDTAFIYEFLQLDLRTGYHPYFSASRDKRVYL
ncbi:hypothetical protein IW261DRAFT_1507365 [Armillaria novae-zelandiae]|uniref:Uncharacterized protein n=1 Tax=Armillaria novae-zelandiae TaxID=153914 RepID=A0AA39NW17_9AGAR|nr:hypothetical protein IW261DRAFT_1507365 [Armillaria novae-zelandiae]